jgi:hypothetical protein
MSDGGEKMKRPPKTDGRLKPYVQITMPDGTSDQIFGFDSRDAAAEWIEVSGANGCGPKRLSLAPDQ